MKLGKDKFSKQVLKFSVCLIKTMKDFNIENYIEIKVNDEKTNQLYKIRIEKINNKKG